MVGKGHALHSAAGAQEQRYLPLGEEVGQEAIHSLLKIKVSCKGKKNKKGTTHDFSCNKLCCCRARLLEWSALQESTHSACRTPRPKSPVKRVWGQGCTGDPFLSLRAEKHTLFLDFQPVACSTLGGGHRNLRRSDGKPLENSSRLCSSVSGATICPYHRCQSPTFRSSSE